MTNVIFVQPFLVNEKIAAQCGERVVVLDVAFNAGSPAGKGTPQEQFENTTDAFINALDHRLVAWIDHHPHQAWSGFTDDPRFVLVPRDQAPACPPLITRELVDQIGDVDTIIAHGDFDGIMSAIKFALGGVEPYIDADLDSIAADSRVGSLSPLAKRLEEAMKADLRDDSIRHAIFDMYTTNDREVAIEADNRIDAAANSYQSIQEETQRITDSYTVNGNVAYVDATEAGALDLTALLLAGQKIAQVAVVRIINMQRGNAQLTVAGPREWDFVKMFGLPGGMPNRVTLPDRDIQEIVETINNK